MFYYVTADYPSSTAFFMGNKLNYAQQLTGMSVRFSQFGFNVLNSQDLKSKHKELLLEAERAFQNNRFPSRLSSFFACESIQDACRFANLYRGPEEIGNACSISVWEVEGKSLFAGDMKMVDNPKKYWQQEMSDNPLVEHLLALPVTVRSRVATFGGPFIRDDILTFIETLDD